METFSYGPIMGICYWHLEEIAEKSETIQYTVDKEYKEILWPLCKTI